eukprot:Gregarina_sp_Poly_1__8769@NODE_525_length_7703_cov_51_704164_g416_i0_p4_GENE_NODE_525_length_7703_cov_51_704164_g416_i0NODE_525_length_7703_cov_51_704164_g416_i0_p4_ORF_typecomplete_len329_score32_29_NODE_525_length_7703_cov_51_704164_g416_i017442730
MSVTESASILVDVERLDTFILPSHPSAVTVLYSASQHLMKELIVCCSLGDKALKSAVGYCAADGNETIAFDSLLHFPFNHAEDKELKFVLCERSTQKELGKCDLSLGVFNSQKSSKCVRIKLKSEQEIGIGFLELKVKLSDVVLLKPSSAKYFRSPQSFRNDLAKIPTYDERIQSLRFAIYSLFDIPIELPGSFMLSVTIGKAVLKIPDLALRPAAIGGTFTIPIDRILVFPYSGFQFARYPKIQRANKLICSYELSLYSIAHPAVVISQAEVDLYDFITTVANVRIGTTAMEAVKSVDEVTSSFGKLSMRMSKSSQAVETPEIVVGL